MTQIPEFTPSWASPVPLARVQEITGEAYPSCDLFFLNAHKLTADERRSIIEERREWLAEAREALRRKRHADVPVALRNNRYYMICRASGIRDAQRSVKQAEASLVAAVARLEAL